MHRYFYRPLVIALWLCFQAITFGQSPVGLVATSEASRYGLHRMWFTQIEVDGARGRVMHLTQHVSATEAITVYEVVYPGGKFSYRETDLDKFGRLIGKDEAKKKAEVKLKDLQAQGIDAKPAVQLVPRITLYAVTDSGLIQAIDSESGRTRWKTSVGTSRRPTEAVGVNDQYVAAVHGSEIFLLDAGKGELVWQRKTIGSPGAGPTLSNELIFVPTINGIVEAYPLADSRATPIVFRSHGRAMIQPLFTGSNVAWSTDRGHLYVSSGKYHHISYRLETKDEIVTPATFLPPNRIVVSSIDGFIYCLQETNGTLQWRYSTGEPIVTTPIPYGDTVYAVTEDGNLFAIDADLGLDRWSIPRMSQVVGASRERLYCLSDVGRLTILDRRTGSHLGSLSTEFDDLPYVNKETDRVIVGTSSGLLQCFREAQQEYPIRHIVLSKPVEPGPKKPIRIQPTEPSKTGPSDPFSPSGETPASPRGPAAIPFDAGENKPAAEPAGKPADNKAEADPFG